MTDEAIIVKDLRWFVSYYPDWDNESGIKELGRRDTCEEDVRKCTNVARNAVLSVVACCGCSGQADSTYT